ncbi:uncharacterized protein LOC135090699 [Scylla paramamosain]|uniref:uncharacterized protein LOC135090699 n=1 Tax=Scylla paramamosain TaxID=85552 RepID=UPI003082EAC8
MVVAVVCTLLKARVPASPKGIQCRPRASSTTCTCCCTTRRTQHYNGDSGFKILIHDPRDDPVIDIRTHGTTINQGLGKDVRVAVREFKTIPTKRWPCVHQHQLLFPRSASPAAFSPPSTPTPRCLMPYMHGEESHNEQSPSQT